MMRLLMCVGVAGAVAYALMPVSVDPEWNAASKVATADPEPVPLGERKLRSWGPTLQSLGRKGQVPSAFSQPSNSFPSARQQAYRPLGPEADQAFEQAPGTGKAADDVGAPVEAARAVGEHVAWARVVLAAKAHSAASVSSSITKFYPVGTELQIVGRESGWIELLDPSTQDRGFVFEKYLIAIDGPSPVKSMTQARAKPLPAVASKLASPAAQTSRQASKPVRQAANDVEVARPNDTASPDRRRDRLTKKEERRERKLFRWFGGREPAPWTVGAPR